MDSRMPVITCTTKAKSSKLPNAAAQRAPPGSGSSRRRAFKCRQLVSSSQTQGAAASIASVVTVYPWCWVQIDLSPLGYPTPETAPLHKQPTSQYLRGQFVHPARRRAGYDFTVAGEDPLVTRA